MRDTLPVREGGPIGERQRALDHGRVDHGGGDHGGEHRSIGRAPGAAADRARAAHRVRVGEGADERSGITERRRAIAGDRLAQRLEGAVRDHVGGQRRAWGRSEPADHVDRRRNGSEPRERRCHEQVEGQRLEPADLDDAGAAGLGCEVVALSDPRDEVDLAADVNVGDAGGYARVDHLGRHARERAGEVDERPRARDERVDRGPVGAVRDQDLRPFGLGPAGDERLEAFPGAAGDAPADPELARAFAKIRNRLAPGDPGRAEDHDGEVACVRSCRDRNQWRHTQPQAEPPAARISSPAPMSRLSSYLLPTLKEPPHDAEAISHKLMVRAGLIRQVGAGMWSYLPAGLRVIQKVEAIVREEMNAIGGQEVLLPVMQPAELWKRTGRYPIEELFKLNDRKGSELVLAMTHEESVTFHVANEIRSYRELPQILYQIQTKERDEPRPRAGVLRTREFTMKDSYSFDRDEAGLDESYEKHRVAYRRIYERCGLRFYEVASDVGMMGGTAAHEYMAPCGAGEDDVAIAPGYAANVEVASALPAPVELPPPLDAPRETPTPGSTTVEDVASVLGVAPGALIKAMPVVVDDDRGLVMVLVRGDHRLNEIKLTNHLGAPFRPAREEEIAERIGPVGFIGPVGLDASIPVIKDAAISGARARLRRERPRRPPDRRRARPRLRVQRGRRARGRARRHDRRRRSDRDPARDRDRQHLQARHALLGAARRHLPGPRGHRAARSSWAVTGSARRGSPQPRSSSSPTSAASSGRRRSRPGRFMWSALGKPGDEVSAAAEALYEELTAAGIETVLDDRENAGAGEKLTDAELLGCPLRLVVGKRGLADGIAEAQFRADGREERVELSGGAAAVQALLAELG